MSERILFCQFSDQLHRLHNVTRKYYETVYPRMPGYHLPEHFFEIPYWIPKAAGQLRNPKYQKEVWIVKNITDTIVHICEGSYDRVLFSVMSINERYIHEIVQACPTKFILGGYTDPAEFLGYKNVRYLNSLNEMVGHFDVTKSGPDYSLFRGLKCIPRLTLSEGCLHKCNFCTSPIGLELTTTEDIESQAKGLEPLIFQLINIDDRTFGQAQNYGKIRDVAAMVKEFNDQFLGFIVQTTPSMAVQDGVIEEWDDFDVKYIELGVETVSEQSLRWLNKPYRLKHLEQLCNYIRKNGRLKIVPNILVCIPGDDYKLTIDWIARNRDIIPAINIYPLSIYFGSLRGSAFIQAKTFEDADDSSFQKSWLASDEVKRSQEAMEEIYRLFE